MPLTEEEKRKIEEKERYKEKVEKKIKRERKSKKYQKVLAIFISVVFFIVVLSVIFPSTENTKPEDKDLEGKVRFDGSQIHITNQEARNWKMCKLTLNGKYHYPIRSGNKKIPKIEANTTYSVGVAQFTLKDGTRFNPLTIKPKDFSIYCQNGFGYWGW